MLPAPIPLHDAARLDALFEYQPGQPFETEICAPLLGLACDLFEVPTAFVSLVGLDAQSFPARLGLTLESTPRDISFCGHAVASGEMLVVPDTVLDSRFSDNPLVLGAPFLRFYAGAPLMSPAGFVIGTFCIADTVPHVRFDAAQRGQLLLLAALALNTLELRRLEIARQTSRSRFEELAATSPDGIVCAGEDGVITLWNGAAEHLFGYAAAEAIGQRIDLIVPERLRHGKDGGLPHFAHGGAARAAGGTNGLVACRRDGSEFSVELSLSSWNEAEGTSYAAIMRDAGERRAGEERLVHAAYHDALTGLPNRAAIRQGIELLAGGTAAATVLLVGLDGFQSVNDELGHAAGDEVLRRVAERLRGCVRSGDTVARVSGDEFALLLPDVVDGLRSSRIASLIIQSLSAPIELADRVVTVGASVGVAVYPSDGTTAAALLSGAERSLYQAKAEGRHGYRTFTTSLLAASDHSRAYGSELRRAYDDGEFEVFYQPQICLRDGALMGAEALLRWRHPNDGLLAPGAFIAALEQRPISAQVGQLVLLTACRQAAVWRGAGAPQFRIGVNLFGSQFTAGTLAKDVIQALLEASLPPSALELEITENIVLRHDENMLAPLRELQARGVSIAFDDFGTGYGSLSMLKRFPIARLKVDQSFVRGMCESPEDAAIVRCILYLGRAFGFKIIAEGVETLGQAECLAADGCDEVQGYLYGRPMPASEFTAGFGLDRPDPLMAALADATARRNARPPKARRRELI